MVTPDLMWIDGRRARDVVRARRVKDARPRALGGSLGPERAVGRGACGVGYKRAGKPRVALCEEEGPEAE
jgi:hypothetical protein